MTDVSIVVAYLANPVYDQYCLKLDADIMQLDVMLTVVMT